MSAPLQPRMARPLGTASSMTESQALGFNGFAAAALLATAALLALAMALTHYLLAALVTGMVIGLMLKGFYVLEPGTALVTTFFGQYSGSLRDEGLVWINPLCSTERVSIKANNLATPTLKVNDASGNPIEVAAAVVWEVSDTAKALFSIQDYPRYIAIQAESALRLVASKHPYDHSDAAQGLRGNITGITRELIEAVSGVTRAAGLRVLDARITHLAYAPEVAQAMLRSQQAEQIIAARERIVQGAVKLTADVVSRLKDENIVELTQEDKSRLVINMLTVLVSDTGAQPVLPLGGK